MQRDKLIIIDGSSYVFRAFFAIQRLSTSKGFPTNAIYGFINMLLKVLDVEKPTRLLIAFDTPKPTFRKELYPEYKANRLSPPDDLVKQFPHILRAVDAFGILRLELAGYEADDIIGTVARQAQKEGHPVDIITGDKDLAQLVDGSVTLYDTMKDRRLDPAGVKERFGVEATQIVDYLALMGDSSDNIPGVSGIGEKTAADLLRQFNSLEELYSRIDEIKQPKRRETLLKEKDNAFLSRKLASIDCHVPLDAKWDAFCYTGPKLKELQSFFLEFEFQNLLKRFNFSETTENKFKPAKYTAIQTEAALVATVAKLEKLGCFAVDTETTSLSPRAAKLVGVSLCGSETDAYYIPLGHCAPGQLEDLLPGQLDETLARRHMKPLLENPKVKKVGQNLKYDTQILRGWGVEMRGLECDTLLVSYLLDPEQPHNLDSLAFRYLGHQNISYTDVTGTGKSQKNFAEVAIETASQYSAEDADVTWRLYQKLTPELSRNHLEELNRKIELPLVQVLADMEYDGILVDRNHLEKMSVQLTTDIQESEQTIFGLAGETFNINSPKQLGNILFEKLKLPVIRKTKTGISTDESVLEKLAAKHEICRFIVRYRELVKLRSTYVEGLLGQIQPSTGRVHTNYNQTVTATGRLSSSNPNLQNIPTDEGGGYDIRQVFIAPPGSLLISADYSQIELRILAHMSGDKELRRAFRSEEDVHEYTARLVFGIQDVSPEQRKIAKTINFGVIYGQTPYGLSQMLGITPSEAKAFIDKYFERYCGVQAFLKGLIEGARENGFVTTQLGRRRFLPEIKTANRMRREMAERAAINAPVQGTAADMIKLAMVNLHRRIYDAKLKAKIVLQVHDELVVEVSEKEQKQIEQFLREEMENAVAMEVPIKVDMAWGKTWRDCG